MSGMCVNWWIGCNMPYITKGQRTVGNPNNSVGELNYAITKLVDAYIINNGGISYKNINAVIGVFECAKLEAYRRLAFYEDHKLAENGEVYDCIKG